MKFTPEHEALRQTWKTLIDREINPYVDEWEKAGQFPAHELFKKMGNAGSAGRRQAGASSAARASISPTP